ncbi:hypothetical protein LVD17_04250 [Fulvivirga ulvae]|uniref:hypothetical protein n=1 Tax=Fulvivirga ulvae TaxID=2904245 RepID=UPI001F1E0CCB|nr:hypothetical protein [Fulvivirga ulvae]UII33038.1 hypothetical protein LVD17_04250 [Fulvivirga ulvae]
MKRNIFKYWFFIMSVGLIFTACQDEYELGEILPVENLQYEITQNPDDPNMIILESLTPNATPLWTTPMGRSTRIKDTVLLPFEGTYKFVYGVQSGGGYVSADTVVLNITTQNLSYVDHPLWSLLTGGGVGHSKTWVLDLNAEGVSKYFSGPQYFFGTDNGWQGECLVEDGDCWSWEPDWQGNQWLADLGDYGEMTFSLEGGAFLTADHKMIPARGQESGTYFLDAGSYRLTTSDVTTLHSPNTDACVTNWGSARIFSLTEDYMQLGFVRSASCDGEAMLVFNYISKEYSDKWVPADTPDPEPDLPDGWMDDVSSIVDNELTWVLSPETPFNYAGLDGSILYSWSSPASYPDSTGFDESVPATYEDFSLTFNSADYTVEYVDPDGNTSNGTYTLNDKGFYTFTGVTPSFNIGSVITLHTSTDNQWRILKLEKDQTGAVTGMWVGVRIDGKDQYLAYHLLLQADAGGGSEGTVVPFNNAKLAFGDLEDNGNLRLELYNDFGSTKADPPLDPVAIVFSNRIEITFTLQGITLAGGASGSYNTAIGLADADWSAQYWGGGPGEVTVTGNGTYTVYAEPGSLYETALVFVIDMSGMAADIDDIGAVTATIDNITLY